MFNDRCRGTFYGLAIGDALGAAVEFKMPGEFSPLWDYHSGGPHGLSPGQWTDDTSMALALADSIKVKGWNLDDQINRYLDWWQNGKYSVNGYCFDIGTTVRTALDEYTRIKDVKNCADPSPESSGNGSIMRLAPVVIHFAKLYPDKIRDLCDLADESSIPTHRSEQSRSACRYLAAILAAFIHGEKREDVLSEEWFKEKDLGPIVPLISNLAKGEYKRKTVYEVVGSGWVVQSLEAALWAFWHASSFEEAICYAVNLGNDADTTGAVCGQIAGAYWGYSSIPKRFIDGLDRKDMIEEGLKGL